MKNKDSMIYLLPTDTCFGMACPVHDYKAYSAIYKIKKRNLNKPLAILVPDYKWLKDNTDIDSEQIDFLKKYNKPFTVLTGSDHLTAWINYVDEDGNDFLNRDEYKEFAFRVANNDTQKRLIKENGPLFLTSANLSTKPEMYSSKDVEEEFKYYLDKQSMKFVGKNVGNLPNNGTSDIFRFTGEELDLEYIRQN